MIYIKKIEWNMDWYTVSNNLFQNVISFIDIKLQDDDYIKNKENLIEEYM